jgi:hypothetical protein
MKEVYKIIGEKKNTVNSPTATVIEYVVAIVSRF